MYPLRWNHALQLNKMSVVSLSVLCTPWMCHLTKSVFLQNLFCRVFEAHLFNDSGWKCTCIVAYHADDAGACFIVQVRSVFLEVKHHFHLVFLWLVHVHCMFFFFLEWNLLFKIFSQTFALCLEWCIRKISAEFMMTLLGSIFSIYTYIIQKDKLHWNPHCNPWLAVCAYRHNKLSSTGTWAWYRVGHSCCKPAESDQWYVSEKVWPYPQLNAIKGSLIFPTRG